MISIIEPAAKPILPPISPPIPLPIILPIIPSMKLTCLHNVIVYKAYVLLFFTAFSNCFNSDNNVYDCAYCFKNLCILIVHYISPSFLFRKAYSYLIIIFAAVYDANNCVDYWAYLLKKFWKSIVVHTFHLLMSTLVRLTLLII